MSSVKNSRASRSPSLPASPPKDSKDLKESKAKGKKRKGALEKPSLTKETPARGLPVAKKKAKTLGRYADEANHTNYRGVAYYKATSATSTRRSTRANPIGEMEDQTPTLSTARLGATATSPTTVATPTSTTVTNATTASANPTNPAVVGDAAPTAGIDAINTASDPEDAASLTGLAPGTIDDVALAPITTSGTTPITTSGTTANATSASNPDTTSAMSSSVAVPPATPLDGYPPTNLPSHQSVLETGYLPAVSPTQPVTAAPAAPAPAPRTGSGRESKPTRKKREAKGTAAAAAKDNDKGWYKGVESPLRFTLDGKVSTNDYQERPIVFQPVIVEATVADQVFNQLQEHPQDSWKKNWKYNVAVPDLAFEATKFTGSEQDPYGPRLSFSARGENMMFSRDGLKVTNSHGWQSVRANVALKEGTYFWEVKVLSNCIDEKNASFHPQLKPGGHIRVGIMRPEGNIEANLGIDGYSYAVTDYNMRIIHAGFQHQLEKDSSRSFRIGDVFGLRLTLPPLAIHRKVVDGSYNPAVDGPETWSLAAETINPASNVVRDRNPFFFKQKHLFFEQQNYNHEELGQANPIIMKGWKVMLDRLYAGGDKSYRNLNPAPMKDDGLQAPNPNHPDSRYRTLPGSKLELFRNGEYLGVIVEDLLAFLVPSSKLHSGGEDRPPGREYADDGSLGYYPAVSSYYGGAAECRFEPPFWFPPATADDAAAPADETGPSVSSTKKAKKGKGKAAPGPVPNRRVYEPVETKSFVDRHNEQIAEEIVFDIIDEVEAGLADELKALDEVDLGVPDAGFVTAAAHSIKMEE